MSPAGRLCCACAVMLCLLSAGCAWVGIRPASLPAIQDPGAYLHEAMLQSKQIAEVSGIAKLRVSQGLKTAGTRNVFFVRRPDRVRIETLGFLSRPALFFTADNASLSLYSIENNAFYSGEPTAENLARIIGIPAELHEVVSAFLGSPPVADCDGRQVTWAGEDGRYIITIACAGKLQHVRIDPAGMRILGFKLLSGGAPVYEYVFSDFREVEGRFFPLKIAINHYTYNTEITLEFESVSFDPIPDDRFHLTPPPGAQVYGIETIGTTH